MVGRPLPEMSKCRAGQWWAGEAVSSQRLRKQVAGTDEANASPRRAGYRDLTSVQHSVCKSVICEATPSMQAEVAVANDSSYKGVLKIPMPSIFDSLVEIVHSGTLDSWKERNEKALAGLFGTRYAKRAEKAVALRAPDMRGSESGVPYAAYIHPSNGDAGAYGGMSFVMFPVEGEPCLVAMVIGTQGLAPDETILGRPGHARKMQAISTWLNHQFGRGDQLAWAKQDPTRIDIDVPGSLQRKWSAYERVFKRYGPVLYAIYKPTADRAGTVAAVTAMLDLMFEERGHTPLKDFQEDSISTQSAWFSHLMPKTHTDDVVELLKTRRYVILQGPPGTGKTRMARQILADQYGGFGRSVQFHPSTTYENFIGGLAPLQDERGRRTRLPLCSETWSSVRSRSSGSRRGQAIPPAHRRD